MHYCGSLECGRLKEYEQKMVNDLSGWEVSDGLRRQWLGMMVLIFDVKGAVCQMLNWGTYNSAERTTRYCSLAVAGE